MDLKSAIRSIPDFPKKGIVFRDITTLLLDPKAFVEALDRMYEFCNKRKVDKIIGIESRGFIFAGALADRLGVGLIPIRKEGKLPGETVAEAYDLEYGSATIEIHADAIAPGESVVIVDDLIATGGTLKATCHLVERMGGTVSGITVLIDLSFLPWHQKLGGYDILSLISYDSE
ncbi:MAG: adenine phosphoribosyltransferase [Candidatus Zixiibacteriota bacterium]|nr:MAG: adenine phosphoribosyltransferase [candidate division Zixibacteria bacterium]